MIKNKVSILSANYNNGSYLKDFFESISNQSYRNIEVVFVDDASIDNSNQIVDYINLNFPFEIRHIKLEENVGFANALNIGLSKCSGEFIARIDPDDVMHHERIGKQVECLRNNPSFSIVGSNAIYFKDSLNKIIGSSNFKSDDKWIREKYLAAEYGMMHGTLLFKRDVFDCVKYSQEEVPAEDYSLLSRMLEKQYKAFNLKESLTFVRIHSNSVSNSLPITTITKLFCIRKEVYGINFSLLSMLSKYFHFKFYRNYLKSKNGFEKFSFLILSSLFAPLKVLGIIKDKAFK